MMESKHHQGWWRLLIIVLLAIGIAFHFIQLDHKVVWHDEVYSILRAAGYTQQDVNSLFQNQIITTGELQTFQRIKPGSTAADTVRSLAIEDPQHPPLYFLMARGWMQAFGNSVLVSRLLPVLISLLALPCMYLLSQELFHPPSTSAPAVWGSDRVSWLATIFLALSPFEILHAQVTRQYSLLTLTTIVSGWLLVRSLRTQTPWAWVGWAIASLLGLYTQPFFGLVLIAQGVYVFGLVAIPQHQPLPLPHYRYWLPYLLGMAGVLLLYSPWLWVMVTQLQRALATTDWTSGRSSLLYLVKLWILSFSCLFLDLDVGFDSLATYLLRLPVIVLAGWGLYTLTQKTQRVAWLYVFTSVLVPFGLLVTADLVTGGQRSAVTRYLTPCYPAIYLAMAYLVATNLHRSAGRGVLAILTSCSIASASVSAGADSWWHQPPSTFNAEIARRVSRDPQTLLVSDVGNDFTNIGDLLSLSYRLPPTTHLLLLASTPDLSIIPTSGTVLAFRPSTQLQKSLTTAGRSLTMIYPEGRLYQIR